MIAPEYVAPAGTASFAWPPLAPEQRGVARDLFRRYCARFGLPTDGEALSPIWLAIVEMRPDGSYGRVGGVLGITWDMAKRSLEVGGLYVYPNRLGARALEATITRLAHLYDSGDVRIVVASVLNDNHRVNRVMARAMGSRGGKPIAAVWALGLGK